MYSFCAGTVAGSLATACNTYAARHSVVSMCHRPCISFLLIHFVLPVTFVSDSFLICSRSFVVFDLSLLSNAACTNNVPVLGFVDEFGAKHTSPYHFTFDVWEVLNEVDSEHQTTVQDYTRRYDAVVAAIRAVAPNTQFMGLALAFHKEFSYYEYFLDPRNHAPGIPLDWISFHFYAEPNSETDMSKWPALFFGQADAFVAETAQIIAIRDRLSPTTKIDIDEVGAIADSQPCCPMAEFYWNLAGATYAYLYGNLGALGVDVLGERCAGCRPSWVLPSDKVLFAVNCEFV